MSGYSEKDNYNACMSIIDYTDLMSYKAHIDCTCISHSLNSQCYQRNDIISDINDTNDNEHNSMYSYDSLNCNDLSDHHGKFNGVINSLSSSQFSVTNSYDNTRDKSDCNASYSIDSWVSYTCALCCDNSQVSSEFDAEEFDNCMYDMHASNLVAAPHNIGIDLTGFNPEFIEKSSALDMLNKNNGKVNVNHDTEFQDSLGVKVDPHVFNINSRCDDNIVYNDCDGDLCDEGHIGEQMDPQPSLAEGGFGFHSDDSTGMVHFGPAQVMTAHHIDSLIKVSNIIKSSGVPNHKLAKFSVPSSFNIPAWQSYLSNYRDPLLIEYLQYGFPLSLVQNSFKARISTYNHSSADNYAESIDTYLKEEISYGAIMGPFQKPPLSDVNVAPMLTRPKDTNTRRVIVDLSYPRGHGLNSFVTSKYDGHNFTLTYPSIDDIVDRVSQLGHNALIYKVDLKRAFRNLKIDPADMNNLGLYWQGNYYIDLAIPFGYVHGSACCQRMTDAIRHICAKQGYWLFNYIDDLIGVELPDKAFDAYQFLLDLLIELGLPISRSKLVGPTSAVTCIGITVDAERGAISIDSHKLASIHQTCFHWLGKNKATPKQLQSLLGQLLYISKCVRPARIFVARMLDLLRENQDCANFQLSHEFFRDLNWFTKFLLQFNGIRVFPYIGNTFEVDLDASPYGLGAVFDKLCYAAKFPFGFNPALTIVHLEMLNVYVALKMWAHHWANSQLKLRSDNAAVVASLNSYRSKDKYLTACCRNIWYILAKYNIQLVASHIPGKMNILPDILSRWFTTAHFKQDYIACLCNNYSWCEVPEAYFMLDWSI